MPSNIQYGEISKELLLDSTDLITSIIVARRMESDQEMPTLQKDCERGNPAGRNITRIDRAGSMIRIREELMKKKEIRKKGSTRTWKPEDFDDLEVKKVTRRASPKECKGGPCL